MSTTRANGFAGLKRRRGLLAGLMPLLIAALAIACAAAGPGPATSPLFAPNLSRGINLAHWFAQSPNGLTERHLTTFVTESDMERLATVGFTHVRLPVELTPAFGTNDESRRIQALLAEGIAKLIASGLAVVVDLHPTDAEKRLVAADPTVLVEGWTRFAGFLARFPPEKLALEVMNEPHPIESRRWHEIQAAAVSAIRAAAPAHTIIVNPGNWSGVDEFADFEALPDRNIIYTAHVYDPSLFTHQGATWSWDIAAAVKDLPWPVAPAEADARARAAAPAGRPLDILKDQIAKGALDRPGMEHNLDKLAAWQRRHPGTFVWIGEFGVYRKFAPREARLEWHQAHRTAFEARGWGWALWDYLGDFGIIQSPKGRAYDGELLERLGFKKEPR
jgi:aryl-phospho-beta-D-glucosidase BglC (GH1 family)